MSTVVELSGVAKTFGRTAALVDASLVVGPGEVHALAGANGSGKTTLIEILLGVESADRGSGLVGGTVIDLQRRDPGRAACLGLRAVHQELALFPDLSITANLAASRHGGSTGALMRWGPLHDAARERLCGVGLDVDPRTPLHRLRPAARILVAIARAMPEGQEPPTVLALDEPTASLDAHEASSLLTAVRELAARGSAIVLVTHRMAELAACADRVTVLRGGRTVARCDRVPDQEELLAEMTGEEPAEASSHEATAGDVRPGGPALELIGIGAGGAHDVSIAVDRGEIVGLSGLRGAGRSSILRAAFGAMPLRRGEIRVQGSPVRLRSPADGIGVGIAFVGDDRLHAGLFADLDLATNLRAGALGERRPLSLIRHRAERCQAASAIARYGIVGNSTSAAGTLSGGNQQKLMLARWLSTKPKVLLLDEPTQGVDLNARAALHEEIRAAARRGTAVLFASSEYEELHSLADRVVTIDRGRVATSLDPDREQVLA